MILLLINFCLFLEGSLGVALLEIETEIQEEVCLGSYGIMMAITIMEANWNCQFFTEFSNLKKTVKMEQNSKVYDEMEEGVVMATSVVEKLNAKKDTSHGLLFSAALGEDKKVKMSMVVWGNPVDIAGMLYTASMKNPEFASIISKVAMNIAVQRIKSEDKKGGKINEQPEKN